MVVEVTYVVFTLLKSSRWLDLDLRIEFKENAQKPSSIQISHLREASFLLCFVFCGHKCCGQLFQKYFGELYLEAYRK